MEEKADPDRGERAKAFEVLKPLPSGGRTAFSIDGDCDSAL